MITHQSPGNQTQSNSAAHLYFHFGEFVFGKLWAKSKSPFFHVPHLLFLRLVVSFGSGFQFGFLFVSSTQNNTEETV
jgi:hypothetical protein